MGEDGYASAGFAEAVKMPRAEARGDLLPFIRSIFLEGVHDVFDIQPMTVLVPSMRFDNR